MNRILYAFLAVLLIVLAASGDAFSQTATAPSGSGTSVDPYQIATLNNLYWMAVHSSSWSSHFVQTANIDASSDSTWNGGSGFPMIGSISGTYFQGTYDGGGHTISGINISQSTSNYIGMFGFSYGATIDSIGVINERITQNGSAQGYVGGLLGGGTNDTISACYTTGSVEGVQYVGGLVGYNGSSSTISVSYSSDSVTTVNGNGGGLVGDNQAPITDCYSTGSVGSSANIGGLVGYNASTISYSYSTGNVTGYINKGGFAGYNASTLTNCFWDTISSGSSTGIGGGTTTGATGKTTVQMKDPTTFTAASWDTSYWYMGNSMNNGYPYLKWQNPNGTHLVTSVAPSYGTGAPTAPYQIASLDNLYWITQNPSSWDLYYQQTANIDASQTSGWNSGAGFSPIGNGTTDFDGNYDGGGHTISGLYISRSTTDYVGLFGLAFATIDSIGLLNESITGQNDVGGLAGYSQLTVSSCYSGGTVSGSGSTGNVGGLVGVNYDGVMSRDYSTASVTGQTVVGGLVGYNISDVVAATINNSYTIGSVSATTIVGGLVGKNDGFVSTVTHCYSTGTVSASGSIPNYAGGLNGINTNSASVDSSFWDTETSSQSSSAGGTGETDGSMKMESTFTNLGWDFTSTWAIGGGTNNGYPYLIGVTDHSLPVQATAFLATASMNSVTLSWSTQSEVDNAGFDVMRENSAAHSFTLIASYRSNDALKGLGTNSNGRTYSFTDSKVESGATYLYKIQSVSTNGTTKDLSTLSVTVDIPKAYALYQNYPNPFNPSTTIRFDLKEQSTATLDIYNVLGQKVIEVNYGTMNAGRYDENINMDRFASGVYFYRIAAAGSAGEKFVSMKKLILLK